MKGQSEESALRKHLLMNYSADIRPVVSSLTITYVKISLAIIQIMDLVSKIKRYIEKKNSHAQIKKFKGRTKSSNDSKYSNSSSII